MVPTHNTCSWGTSPPEGTPKHPALLRSRPLRCTMCRTETLRSLTSHRLLHRSRTEIFASSETQSDAPTPRTHGTEPQCQDLPVAGTGPPVTVPPRLHLQGRQAELLKSSIFHQPGKTTRVQRVQSGKSPKTPPCVFGRSSAFRRVGTLKAGLLQPQNRGSA